MLILKKNVISGLKIKMQYSLTEKGRRNIIGMLFVIY